MDFLDAQAAPVVKGAVHGALLTMLVAACAYNALAYLRRREGHLVVNAMVYGAMCGYELYQTARHARAVGGPPSCDR